MRTRLLRWLPLLALPALLMRPAESLPGPEADRIPAARRRPVALALADGGKRLFVANRDSGSISVIDTQDLRVVGEAAVGRRLADLAAAPGGRLLAVDEEAHELIVLSRRGDALEVVRRLPVSPYPVSVTVTEDGKRCAVASLWSRRLTVLNLTPAARGRSRAIGLPFAPRRQLAVRGGRLIVADSFGGRLAVVGLARGVVESVRDLPAHNIRGLAIGPGGKELFVAHQVLNARAETRLEEVHWGNVLTNNLRALPLEAVLNPTADPLRDGRLHQVDEINRGAGDPAGLAVTARGDVLLTLGGIDAVVLNPHHEEGRTRLATGRRPAAVVAGPDGRRAYVANTFADSLSVVDLPGRKVLAEVPLGSRPRLAPAEQGELLFHDARLSHDGWLSCHSCHTDGHSNGRLSDTQGDGSFGAPKRVLSLLGTADTGPWAWNGSISDLEGQVRRSVRTTMHGRKLSGEQVEALAVYLKRLAPPPPLGRFAEKPDAAARRRGREVFNKHSCANCHTPPSYTSRRTHDVGLIDEVGNRQFNPPSLRGVSQGGPYFHDGRAATLEDVFTRHRHQLQGDLTTGELNDLLTFLRSL